MKNKKFLQNIKRGRPKDLSKREQILSAAGDLIVEHGLAHVSMDAIAKQADVSKQTIYSNFSNKETLFTDMVTHKVDSYQLDVDTNLDYTSPKSCLEEIVIAESIHHPRIGELFYEHGPQRTLNFVESCLKKMQLAKTLKLIDPQKASIHFLNLLKGDVYLRLLMNHDIHLDARSKTKHLKECVSAFLKIYGPSSDKDS